MLTAHKFVLNSATWSSKVTHKIHSVQLPSPYTKSGTLFLVFISYMFRSRQTTVKRRTFQCTNTHLQDPCAMIVVWWHTCNDTGVKFDAI